MTDRPTRLIIVRHAEPSADARGRCYGSLDIGLSDSGTAQALALADALSTAEIAAVFSSPRIRALRTAEPIAQSHALRVIVDEDLRELDFGDLEGKRFDEIAATLPSLYEQWMTAPTAVAFPGGESFGELRSRAIAASARIRGECEGSTSVLTTHGGVCRAIIADALVLDPASIFRFDVGHARTTVIDWFGHDPVVRVVNASNADVPLLLERHKLASRC
jgi:alpha-ribazole phosphatase